MADSYLIIGGSSDIALQLVSQLLDTGNNVTVLARDESRVSSLKELGVNVVIGDGLIESDVLAAIDVAKQTGDGAIAGAAHLIGSILLKPPHAFEISRLRISYSNKPDQCISLIVVDF